MSTLRTSSEAGPSSSGSQTPTLMPPDPPMSRDPDESRALTFRVYKEVWDEFNKWKVENCEQQLLLLQKPLPPPAAAEDALLEASNLREGEPGEVEIIYLCESDDEILLLPFVPYADDPTFDAKAYLEMYAGKRFAWEELGDPDGTQLALTYLWLLFDPSPWYQWR